MFSYDSDHEQSYVLKKSQWGILTENLTKILRKFTNFICLFTSAPACDILDTENIGQKGRKINEKEPGRVADNPVHSGGRGFRFKADKDICRIENGDCGRF